MALHNFRLNQSSFATISTGAQTIELRLYDEKRRLVRPSDRIFFDYYEKSCAADVAGLSISDSFANLCKMINVPDTCWRDSDELVSGMKNYYSDAEQKKHGVIGIHLRLVR